MIDADCKIDHILQSMHLSAETKYLANQIYSLMLIYQPVHYNADNCNVFICLL
jgi:hypothetical protein